MIQDLMVCLQEAISYFICRKPWIPKHQSACLVNIPCQCPHPGKELQCEDCPYLEACFSSVKLHQK